MGNVTNVGCGENHCSQFIGSQSEILDFRVHLVYLIVGLKIEEVISGPPEQVYSTTATLRCREVGGRSRFWGHRQ